RHTDFSRDWSSGVCSSDLSLPPERRLELVRASAGDEAAALLDGLAGELDDVRATGVAFDEETYSIGLRCRAAAIRGRDGTAIGEIGRASWRGVGEAWRGAV